MFDNNPWSDRHRLMRHALNADQAELAAMVSGSAPVSSGIEDDRLAGVTEDEVDGPDTDSWSRREEAVEAASGETLAELERRVKLIGAAYPFTLNGGALTYRKSATGIYEYCLATSLAPDVNSTKYLPLSVHFELLACEVARSYLGKNAQSIRTGWPSHNLTERPTKFKAMSEIVKQRCGEWNWKPSPPNPDDPPHTAVKDEGVDYIVWMPMLDARAGKLFLLGQCACGDGWDGKLADINKDKLGQWLDPITSASYLTAFSVPRHIAGNYIFHYCNVHAGITFDRARISLIAEALENRDMFIKFATNWKLADHTRLVIPTFN